MSSHNDKRRRPPTTSHNYTAAIMNLATDNPEVGLKHINIEHDDWCDALNGSGFCNCRPTVSWRKEDRGLN